MSTSPPPLEPVARVCALFEETARLHAALAPVAPQVAAAASAMAAAIRAGGKVLVCGNGGSAAEAQHFAAELVGRFQRARAAWPAIALTTDSSALTAIGNDYGFERVFARQVEGLGRAGDVLLAVSTSGQSPNVVAAVEAGTAAGLLTVALTGRDGGAAGAMAAIHVNVAHASAARAQEAHLTILHAMCELIEEDLAR